jgi:hypothetical protein
MSSMSCDAPTAGSFSWATAAWLGGGSIGGALPFGIVYSGTEVMIWPDDLPVHPRDPGRRKSKRVAP